MFKIVPYSTWHEDGWLFSESLTVTGGFVHIISRYAGDAYETEITEHRVYPDNSWDIGYAVLIEHGQLPLPRCLALQVWHEHMLARHQMLFRTRPLPYLVQVIASVSAQLGDAMRDNLQKLRHWRTV